MACKTESVWTMNFNEIHYRVWKKHPRIKKFDKTVCGFFKQASLIASFFAGLFVIFIILSSLCSAACI